MAFEQSLPYLKLLLKAPQESTMKMLQSFPKFVIDDLLEIVVNIVRGNVILNQDKKLILQHHKKPLLSIVKTKNKKLMRKIIYKQKGGFIAALLPIALAALGLTNLL